MRNVQHCGKIVALYRENWEDGKHVLSFHHVTKSEMTDDANARA